LLLVIQGFIFHKKKIRCKQWYHTEFSGAENCKLVC
jgi:hypothetical protein